MTYILEYRRSPEGCKLNDLELAVTLPELGLGGRAGRAQPGVA